MNLVTTVSHFAQCFPLCTSNRVQLFRVSATSRFAVAFRYRRFAFLLRLMMSVIIVSSRAEVSRVSRLNPSVDFLVFDRYPSLTVSGYRQF
jgi:hypothetical protein